MGRRWVILALLFVVRSTMAFQFESIAALAPLLQRDLGIDIADIGFLVGLYLAPGVVLALPSGAIGRRLGDRAASLAGFGLMVAGGVLVAIAPDMSFLIVGRLVSGAGGVLAGVVMTKMVTDWFSGRELATAMAVFINSWPVGIAVALLAMPPFAGAFGTVAALAFAAALTALGFVLLAACYWPPARVEAAPEMAERPARSAITAVIVAGLIWGIYNVAFVLVFSFGPTMLVERGYTATAAGAAVSLVMWLTILSVPLGGVLADRTGRRNGILVAGTIVSAALVALAAHAGEIVLIFTALGLIFGLPAGVIMSLPAQVLRPESRAVGMGLFYTVFYLAMMIGPSLGGLIAARIGSAQASFDLGAVLLLACPLLLVLFLQVTARRDVAEPEMAR